MKTTKYIYGILVVCVSALILMQSVLAATGPPYVWARQATLSTADAFASQDPENSGFGIFQVSVWEEWNGADWDIFFKYSINDGLAWLVPPPPATHPATTAADEINPAVSVTQNLAPIGGPAQEIHVVYQRWNPAGGGFWEICHTYTNNLGVAWVGPVVISTAGVSSTNPACVYTEDYALPGGGATPGTMVHFVWEEALAVWGFQIMYRGYYYDPAVPARNYVPLLIAAPAIIRTPPGGGSSELPEIASVVDRFTPAFYNFYFCIVWQEFDPVLGNWNVWECAGTTSTAAVAVTAAPASLTANPLCDHTAPDVAASQDYALLGAPQAYYFHVDYVRVTIAAPFTFWLDSCYTPIGPMPAAGAFIGTAAVWTAGTPVVPPILIDDPTIATKLTSPLGAPPVFEIWFAWEDDTVLPLPDIWYRVGTYTTLPPAFAFTVVAGRVPYLPNPSVDTEQNPELWNREDATRLNPPVTHLVFDRNPDPVGGGIEVEYIDP